MRSELKKLYDTLENNDTNNSIVNNNKLKFRATLTKRGNTRKLIDGKKVTVGKKTSVLLENITLNGILIADHVWVQDGKKFKGLSKNSIYTFNADIYEYTRQNNTVDYALGNIDSIELIK